MIKWEQQPPERNGIYTCDGYEVRWYYEGGSGLKKWQATNPEGVVRKGFLSKREAMEICEAGIKRRKNSRSQSSVSVDEMRTMCHAQIAAMREMLRD